MYKFEKLGVSKATKVAADATNPEQLKVTFNDGNTAKIDIAQNEKVCKVLRPGVEVSGFFQRMMPWSVEGNDGKINGTALVGAVITKVEKGAAVSADIEEGIEETDWDKVQGKERPVYTQQPPADTKHGGITSPESGDAD